MEQKSNKINVHIQNASNSLYISAPNVKQTITTTNNRAQYYSDLAKKYKDEAKSFRDDAKFYAEQNSDVTLEYVDSIKFELQQRIEHVCNNLEENITAQIPQKVSELNNDIPFASLTDLENSIDEIRLPSQSNCEGSFLYTDGVNTSWQEVPSCYNLFDVIIKDHILSFAESKGWALQGTYVYSTALAGSRYGYPDFYNKCLSEKNTATAKQLTLGSTTITMYVNSNGHQFYDIADKAAVDSWFSTYGTAWFYGVDTVNKRVFLPRNNFFEQLTCSTSEVGQSVKAGLPNISGTTGRFLTSAQGNSGYWTGAFSTSSSINDHGAHSYNDERYGVDVVFNASKSNSTYGSSATVQPNSVKKLLYICVGNTTSYEGITNIIDNELEILEQVNKGVSEGVAAGISSRVKLDGSNATFVRITKTYINGSSWYRIYSDGWCEQGGAYDNGSVMRDKHGINVTFLQSFKDTNYVIIPFSYKNDNNPAYRTSVANVYYKTTSQATLGWYGLDNNQGAQYLNWYACGYIK